MKPSEPTNQEQKEFWNDLKGQIWVEMQPRIDGMLAPFDERTMQTLELRSGERVLEIGCGTGTSSLGLLQRIGPSGSLLAVDLSRTMLNRAEERIEEAGVSNAKFVEADAQVHDFPAGVFTGRGLVGVARAPHGNGAHGEFWSHPDFRVSVVTEDGQVRGIVRASRPDGGQAVLVLDGAPFQSNVRNGTLLVTTGIAGVYPPGVLVGTVRRVLDAEAGWMKSYIVEPSVRPEEASIVLIWERPRLAEESVPTAPVHSLDSNPTMRP